MSSQERKTDLYLSTTDTASLFRNLATAIEGGDEKLLNDLGISIKDSKKIKLEIKCGEEKLSVKVKVKNKAVEAEGGEMTEAGENVPKKPGYKPLKKRMSGTFKSIKKSLLAATPPSSEDLNLFLEDAAEMVTYPGFGNKYYPAFTEACQYFEKAAAAGNLEEMLIAFSKIDVCRLACHDRYK
jgi:XXXCH domain-containing protein